MGFFSNLFKGSQPEEKHEDKEYAEFLLKELENLKKETNRTLEEEHKKVSELQAKFEKEQEEKEALKKKISDYEGSYSDFSKIISAAKLEAGDTVEKARQEAKTALLTARQDAERITTAAKAEAALLKQNTEKQLKEKAKADEQRYTIAKYKLMEYLNSINKTQSKLVETYNELGELIQKMPLRIDDLLSDEPMGLLPESKEDDRKWTAEVVDEADKDH